MLTTPLIFNFKKNFPKKWHFRKILVNFGNSRGGPGWPWGPVHRYNVPSGSLSVEINYNGAIIFQFAACKWLTVYPPKIEIFGGGTGSGALRPFVGGKVKVWPPKGRDVEAGFPRKKEPTPHLPPSGRYWGGRFYLRGLAPDPLRGVGGEG